MTVCSHNRECLFGSLTHEAFVLSPYGKIVESSWMEIPHHYANVTLDVFALLPNHLHGIITIEDSCVGAGYQPALVESRSSLPEIIRAFKTHSAREINDRRSTSGAPVWQRSYYEHIIRNEREMEQTREYISANQLKWALDRENPQCTGVSLLEKTLFGR